MTKREEVFDDALSPNFENALPHGRRKTVYKKPETPKLKNFRHDVRVTRKSEILKGLLQSAEEEEEEGDDSLLRVYESPQIACLSIHRYERSAYVSPTIWADIGLDGNVCVCHKVTQSVFL